jgi:hypothetical protein
MICEVKIVFNDGFGLIFLGFRRREMVENIVYDRLHHDPVMLQLNYFFNEKKIFRH